MRPFAQVDVFTTTPYRGNPVAVVMDGDGLSTEEMQRFANWTNLSETTFIVSPSDPAADYRVRIFTTEVELPFAGHPTIGTCHAWLEAGGTPRTDGVVIQECDAGLITIRDDDGLAFAAPPLLRHATPLPGKSASIRARRLGRALIATNWAVEELTGFKPSHPADLKTHAEYTWSGREKT